MSKKETLELLIKSFGLTPKDVHHYRTDGCDGQYEIKVGWKGDGVDKDGNYLISFFEPEGFEFAVYDILKQAHRNGLKPVLAV